MNDDYISLRRMIGRIDGIYRYAIHMGINPLSMDEESIRIYVLIDIFNHGYAAGSKHRNNITNDEYCKESNGIAMDIASLTIDEYVDKYSLTKRSNEKLREMLVMFDILDRAYFAGGSSMVNAE